VGTGSPSKMSEEFVADLYVHLGEELRHGRIQARHDHVIVVHLASMGHYRNLEDSANAEILRAWLMPPTRLVSNWM